MARSEPGTAVRFQVPTSTDLTEIIVDAAGAGDNTIISGVAAQTIRIWKIFFVCDADVSVLFKDGAGINLTGLVAMKANGSVVLDFDGEPWFTASAGNAFIINLSGAFGIRGRCYYSQS